MNDALEEAAGLFLRLGFTAFGEPAALIPLLRDKMAGMAHGFVAGPGS